MKAIIFARLESVKLLLRFGSDLSITNKVQIIIYRIIKMLKIMLIQVEIVIL